MAATRESHAVPRREQCLSCAYPLDGDRDIFSVLSRLKGMMSHVGYTVDRFLVEESRDSVGTKSVTLELRPSFSPKRSRPVSPDCLSLDPPTKRTAVPACRLCASSCCSTNSLCKANVCGHRGEEESAPAPPSPERHKHHNHSRKYGHSHSHGHSRPHLVPAPGRPVHHHHGQRSHPQPVVPDPEPAALSPPALEERGCEKSVAIEQNHARGRFGGNAQEINHLQSEQKAAEVVVDEPQRQKTRRDDMGPQHAEPPRSIIPARSAHVGQSTIAQPVQAEHSQEKENGSGWTATTAPAGAAFDVTCAQRLGPADLRGRFGAGISVPTPRQTGSARRKRSSPMSRQTSWDPNAGGIESGARSGEEVDKEGMGAAAASAEATRVASAELRRPPPELVCSPCGLRFSEELELRRHQFIEHKDGKIGQRTIEGRFLCLMHSCKQSFVRRHVMERHFKSVHLLVREFPCSSCDKSFADSSTREAHLSAVHEKRKPYICDQCASCFTQSSSLGKHRRRFHQESILAGVQAKR